MQTVRDRFPRPLQEAALADYWNAIAARSAQLVRWPTIIQQRPAQLANDEDIGLPRDRLTGRSAMRTHHLERFCPCHAGKTACKRHSASERRVVQFNNGHSRPPAERLTLSTCLPFSRPASACTRCGSLLFLSVHTGAKSLHQIHHPRRRNVANRLDRLASLFLLQQVDQSVFVTILELRRVQVARLGLHDVGGQVEHVLRKL